MNAISKIPLPRTAFQLGIYFLIEKQSDLTLRQLGVLLECSESPKTVRGMAAYFGISKTAISRAADKLEEMGMICRKTDKKDRRSVDLVITLNGVRFLNKLYKTIEV